MTRLIEGCRDELDTEKGSHSLAAVLGLKATSAKATLDLTHLIRKILDQGPYGLCVGFGVKRACENAARQGNFPNLEDLSALGVYRGGRAVEHTLDLRMDGTTNSAALYGLEQVGFQYDKELPYEPKKRFDGIKLGKGQAGLRRAGVRSHRFTETPGPALEEAMKTALCSGKGIVGSFRVGDGFEKWRPEDGPWEGDDYGSMIGHSMPIHDYPDGLPRIVNSWGIGVGDGGIWTSTWGWVMKAKALFCVDFIPSA